MTGSLWAMPSARATHASHRAVLRRLGLSVGIAIALTGCGSEISSETRARHFLTYCINRAADSDVVDLAAAIRECDRAAQRIEARSDETRNAAQPEGREPDGEAGAPKGNQHDQ